MSTKALYVEIPDELHRAIKAEAARQGFSLREYVSCLLVAVLEAGDQRPSEPEPASDGRHDWSNVPTIPEDSVVSGS